MYPIILVKVGNGLNTSTWFDYWHSLSPLIGHFGNRILYDSFSPRNAMLNSFILGREQNWLNANSHRIMELISSTPHNHSSNESCGDSAFWISSRSGVFSIKSAWEC